MTMPAECGNPDTLFQSVEIGRTDPDTLLAIFGNFFRRAFHSEFLKTAQSPSGSVRMWRETARECQLGDIA